MIKVVIADDEVKVCQLICHLVDWSSFDMSIVGTAHNGVDAVRLIEELRPDLVITDIRMPGHDGLEMIEITKKIDEKIDFIIISGYRHFEYAKRAIQFGVFDYLLKPIKKDDLAQTLQKMKNRYLQRASQLTMEEQLRLYQQSDKERVRSRVFGRLLTQKELSQPVSLAELNEQFHFSFCPGLFQVLVIKLDYPYEEHYQDAASVMLEKAAQRLTDDLQALCYDGQTFVIGTRVYAIFNYDLGNAVALRHQLKAALDTLVMQAGVFEYMQLSIGLGHPVEDVASLDESLAAAEASVANRIVEGTGMIIESDTQIDSAVGDDPLMGFRKRVESAVDVLNHELLRAALEALQTQCLSVPTLSGARLVACVQDAFRIFLTCLSNQHSQIGFEVETYGGFVRKVDLCGSAAMLFELLGKETARLLTDTTERHRQVEKMPIREAKQYIHKNFAKPITLEEISGVVGFNSSYFSTLFKKESGQTFMEYVAEVRMNHAKDLLKETNLTVAAICSEVGYSDLKHFSQNFKKHTGLKPNEYRKLFS